MTIPGEVSFLPNEVPKLVADAILEALAEA